MIPFSCQKTPESEYRGTKDRYENALEVGCSIGIFTAMLAPRCTRLLSVDVAEAALEQARQHCRGLAQVSFLRMEVPLEFPEGQFDLVVVSEVGYYWSRDDLRKAQDQIASHLSASGTLLLVHWRPFVPDYPLTGDQVHESFLNRNEFQRTRGGVRERYRLDVLERV